MSGSESKIYDRAEAIERLDGNEPLFAEMAEMFVAESEAYCAELERAVASGDAEAVRREAHTLKSLLATFSSEAGRVLAMQLEMLAASGSLEDAESLTVEVLAAVRRLAAALASETA